MPVRRAGWLAHAVTVTTKKKYVHISTPASGKKEKTEERQAWKKNHAEILLISC